MVLCILAITKVSPEISDLSVCVKNYELFFSDLSALDVNVMFVHVFILVLMGLLTALQPWVGLACSTCMCMQPLLIIITALIITTLISYHLIASSLSLSLSLISLYIILLSLSLSLSHQHQHQHQYHYRHISISTHQQHISSTSAAYQHIATSPHHHIITVTSASSASHQAGSPLGKHQHDNM